MHISKVVLLFVSCREGEKWLKMRSVLRQLIMRPRDVAVFSEDVNLVVDDLVKRVGSLRSRSSDGESVVNINDLFFKFAMEANQGASYVQKKSQPFSLGVLLTLHLLCSLLLFSLSSFLLLSSPPFCLWKEVTVIAKLDVGDIALG